jgi:superfamily II DNA or RNA helicase
MDIKITNVDAAYIHVECDEGIAYELSDYFTFRVPGYMFTPAYKNGMWDGYIRLFNLRSRQILRGLVYHIRQFAVERNYIVEYDSFEAEYSVVEANDFLNKLKIPFDIHDYQKDAFIQSIQEMRALLLCPTASGKSLIIYLISRCLLEAGFKKGLIVVPIIQLVEQLKKNFEEYSVNDSWSTDDNVHQIYQGKDKTVNKPITISTWQSIYKFPKEFFKDYDFVIGDEAHTFGAKSLTSIMAKMPNTIYRIGTTGTIEDTKVHKLVLEGIFGPVKNVISTKELMDQDILSQLSISCLILKHTEENCNLVKKFTYDKEMKYIIESEARNRFIRNLALSLEGNTLLFFRYVKHGKLLYEMIRDEASKGRKVFFIYGKTDIVIREEIRDIVEKEKDAIIVASIGTTSTGINIVNLNNIIGASPLKAKIKNLQSIGRVLRKGENTKVKLFDISDDLRHKKHTNFTLKHFESRLKIYANEKFDFKTYKIQLKG